MLRHKVENSHQQLVNVDNITFGGFSCAGVKAENQDAFTACMPKLSDVQSKGFVANIADGLSSASKAQEAAQLAVTQFVQDYYSTPQTWTVAKSAEKVVSSLNEWMYSKSDAFHNDDQQWLTTFSSLIVKSTTGYVFHVGDTRVYQLRAGQLTQITKDHCHGSKYQQSILTRALGADFRLKLDALQIPLQHNDIYLLSTDGLHDFVSTSDITSALIELPNKPTKKQLEDVSSMLVSLAIEQGSDDNVSCLLVAVGTLPFKELKEVETELLSKKVLPSLEVGMKLDGYNIIKKIHESARSHLYLVNKEGNDEPFVLKVPSINFSDDATYLQGFMREAWLGERVNHQNIMKIKSASQPSQYLYHFCEYIPGQTLSEWMYDNPQPSISQVREILKQIIAALRALQRMDVVHRDLKPENIMIDEFGKITLIDYGTALIASLQENSDTLHEDVPLGTLNYIAPETILSLKATHQSDLFSLGVIAFELLTGELPFKPLSRHKAMNANIDEWQYRSIRQFRQDIPLWLDFAIKRATEPKEQDRYQAYSEFEADISKPNHSAVAEYQRQPILVRDPVLFWQGLSFLLFLLLLTSLAF